jgi:hypothetical protein
MRSGLIDTDPSSRYFKISQLPEILTGGKNSFLINGSEELVITTDVKIEIIDSAGNTVYVQPIKFYAEGGSRLVSIEVYGDSSPGLATLTILGHLKQDANGNLPPDQFANAYNVKWQAQIPISPTHQNTTRIRLYKTPTLNVSELLVPYRDSTSGSAQFVFGPPNSVVANMMLPYSTGQKLASVTALTPTLFTFSRLLKGATFMAQVGGQAFTSSISDVLNSSTAFLSNSFSQNNVPTGFTPGSFKIAFTTEDIFVTTNLNRSFADIRLGALRTFSGEVHRAKVYARSVDQPLNYTQVADVPLQPLDLLVTASSATGDYNISQGFIKDQSTIAAYWNSGLIAGGTSYAVNTPTPTGLLIWLAADTINQVDGSQVTSWKDLSAIGNDVAQSTPTNTPVLVASSSVNGKPAVRFDGVNDYLSRSTGGVTGQVPHSIIVVAKMKTLGDHYTALATLGTGVANTSTVGLTDSGHEWAGGASDGTATIATVDDTVPHIFTKIGANDGTATQCSFIFRWN